VKLFILADVLTSRKKDCGKQQFCTNSIIIYLHKRAWNYQKKGRKEMLLIVLLRCFIVNYVEDFRRDHISCWNISS